MNPDQYRRSVQLYESAQKVLATGVSSAMRRRATPIPLYFDRGDGPYFYDVDGRQLLDYTLGWGPLIVGSNHPALNNAITQQLARGYTFGAQHELELQVATRMTQLVPGLEQVIFSNTGTEAVQAAIRIARSYTGRECVLKFEGHYHGWMNNILVSYHPTKGQPIEPQPTCGGQPSAEYSQTFVLPWNDPAAFRTAIELHGDKIACVITEPLLANSGCCEPSPGFLELLVDLCQRHGIVSIFDEVITGFRLALGGAREFYGVIPDLSVYGKALAGGFSLSAVGGRAAVFDVLRDGRTFHAGTYNGNSICLAAAKATLEILASPGVFEAMRAHGRRLRTALREAAESHPVPMIVSGADTVFSVHFGINQSPRNYRDTLQTSAAMLQRFQLAMLVRGVYLLPDGRWYIGAAHDDQALAIAESAINESICELSQTI